MTAPAVPEGLEPLAVWDSRDRIGPWRAGTEEDREARWKLMAEASDWAREHIKLAEDTYRIDFYLLDALFAVAYRYKRDDGGHKYRDPATGGIAREGPVIVPLAELPPPHLLKG